MTPSAAEALAQAREAGLDRLDAQLLLAWVLQRPRAWLIANGETRLDEAQARRHADGVARRLTGEPLAYIVGEKEFHGLLLKVSPAVLVPRPDTETLVDWALQLLQRELAGIASPDVIDLGTGSGAIALAVKHRASQVHMTAVDSSAEALAIARANGHRVGVDVDWRQGDWWGAVADRRFHLALSNPPYIAEGDAHLAALIHEPAIALSSGADGLNAIRTIIAGSAACLAPGAWLLLEHGHDQADRVAELLHTSHFEQVQSRADLAGIARCTGGRWRGV